MAVNRELNIEDIPIVPKSRADRNSTALRAALAILYDLKECGHIYYNAVSSSYSNGPHRIEGYEIIVAYRVETDEERERKYQELQQKKLKAMREG